MNFGHSKMNIRFVSDQREEICMSVSNHGMSSQSCIQISAIARHDWRQTSGPEQNANYCFFRQSRPHKHYNPDWGRLLNSAEVTPYKY